MTLSAAQRELRKLADAEVARHSLRFFKTGKGEYGEGDRFLGVRVPVIRATARTHKTLPLDNILDILSSRYHEERLLALVMLVNRFKTSDQADRKAIYEAYLANTQQVNGWDLVDSSAHQIVGAYLEPGNRRKLLSLARSNSLWERRIAIIATYHFIRLDQYDDTLAVSERLLTDKEDLIHKAVGWMLREVGNRNLEAEEAFLNTHYKNMPRTMLRYAIEKFDPRRRKAYLAGTL